MGNNNSVQIHQLTQVRQHTHTQKKAQVNEELLQPTTNNFVPLMIKGLKQNTSFKGRHLLL